MQDAFTQVEEEFFRLRGQFAVGRITAEEYDEALRHLQVRDAEGRVWMLGANSGRWYYTTSPQWVEGDPVHDPNAEADQVVFSNRPSILQEDDNTSSPEAEPPPPPGEIPEDELESSGSTRRLALVFFAIGVTFLLIALAFFILFAPNNNLFAGATLDAMPTRIAPRISTDVAQNNAVALPGATATRTPTRAGATMGAPIPVTVTPGLVIEPTSTEPALTVIPTITPNANPNSDTEPRVTLPPAVYITNIRVSPNPPGRGNPVTFTASFYNTNRDSVGMNWRIILMDPNRQGDNKDYGESPFTGITVPPGRTDFSITFVPVTDGACTTLQVLAARRQDDNSRDYLSATTGGRFATYINFC